MANPVEKKFRERLKKFLTEKNPPKKWKALTKIIGMFALRTDPNFFAFLAARHFARCSLFNFADKETPENVTQLFLKQQDDIIFTLTKFQQSLEQLRGVPSFSIPHLSRPKIPFLLTSPVPVTYFN